MDELIVIKVMNEAMLRLKNSKNENSSFNEKIKEYLKDEAFFFKISKENAFKVLVGVGVLDEKLEETYQKLITKSTYDRLLQNGVIKPTDNLTVKYN
jgi:hypothetical protein